MTAAKPLSSPVGTLLRQWRATRGRSQLELAMDMGVSQRHVSFIESGRSTPSRALLLGLCNALDVPLRDRNAWLLAAGYAPMYAEPAWDAAEMRGVHRALERMLKQARAVSRAGDGSALERAHDQRGGAKVLRALH